MRERTMTRVMVVMAAAGVLVGAGLVAGAGPLDFLKGAASKAPGGNKVTKYVDSGAKILDAAGVDTPEGRDRIGQAVALAATAKYRGLDERDAVQAYVTFVGLAVAHAADPGESHGRYVFGVLNSDEPTACSGPGGYVMVTRGALAMMDDESELAGVLAHEIAHVAENHGIKSVQTSKMVDAGVGVASASDQRFAAFNSVSDNLVQNILEKGYSRGQEEEADKLAVRYVSKAGYDPMGYVRFLRKLDKAKASGGSPFATHPATAERIKAADKLARGGGMALAERFRKNVPPG